MNWLSGVNRWLLLIGIGSMIQAAVLGQVLRLPGGITITEPRSGNHPVNHPERISPDRVCPKTIEWVGILQREYPNVDLGRTVSDRVQQMAIPLFADAVFKQEFGVSYANLSDADRHNFFRMHLIPCTNQRLYGQQMVVLQVFNTPFMSGTGGIGPLAPGQLLPSLDRLATARATLQSNEQSLAATPPTVESYDHATTLSARLKDDLAVVWPSEKAHFESVVNDAIARSASVAVQAKIQPLITAPATPETARLLRDAPQTYSTLFSAMPPDQSAQLKAKLEERRYSVLRDLLPPEQTKASAFPATLQGLADGGTWYGNFVSVFLQPPAAPEADLVAKAYLVRREIVLGRMAPHFRQKIETTQDADTVATLYDDVFRLPEDRQSTTWQDLSALRASRAKLLTDRAEQSRRVTQAREEHAALLRGDLVESSLKTVGLQNEAAFRAIYAGEAVSAGISRSNILFAKMFEAYLISFGQTCQSALPPNRVRMTYQHCTEHDHYTTYNGWYVSTRDECGNYETRDYEPPAFADPRAYRAQQGAETMAGLAYIQAGMKQVFINPMSTFSTLGDAVLSKATVEQDIGVLLDENSCNSKALIRLQENMTRLALDQDPLHLPGYTPDRTHTTLASDLDVRGLSDALIRADASGWAFNHYQALEGAGVTGAVDTEGRPRRVHATYSQQGLTSESSVEIAFTEGTPSCLYFADAPSTCKAPSKTVIKQYQDGDYRRNSRR